MSTATTAFSGNTAAKYGCIATFENADGLVMSRHAAGPPIKALQHLCDHAASIDPSYRVIGYSTPQGIIRDLIGRECRFDKSGRALRYPSPEKAALTRAGRANMLHPRLAV